MQLKFYLDDDEWAGLADEYKDGVADQTLTVRRYFKLRRRDPSSEGSKQHLRLQQGQLRTVLFYGAKNVGTDKVGQVLYVPALTTPAEQTKMSGPSPLRNMLNFLLKKVVSKSDAYKNRDRQIIPDTK